jgi:hypothetical protein
MLGREKDVSKAIKIAIMRATSPDEWVAAEVTKVDKADVPMAGVVLMHSPDKHAVHRTVKVYLAQYPAARLFILPHPSTCGGRPMP